MLYYFPFRYIEFAGMKNISELISGEHSSVIGEIERSVAEKTWKKKMKLAEIIVKDDTGRIKCIWFNQPYLANKIRPEMKVMISGKVLSGKNGLFFANPEWHALSENLQPATNYPQQISLLPIYSETYGVSSSWIRWQIKRLFEKITDFPEIIPEEILKKYHLPGIKRALTAAHFPKTPAESEAAKKRFAFEEIFFIQLNRQSQKKKNEEIRGVSVNPNEKLVKEFKESLSYKLTSAQERVISQILDDFKKSHPMSRLLEGDVGSGKTIVAAAVSLNVINDNYQVAFMAPTEILARQHFEEFIHRLEPFHVSIGLLTSSESKKFPSKIAFKKSTDVSKSQLLKFAESGDIKILIGTHALIQDKVKFKKLGLVIIDEQHRFGTKQRANLAKNKEEIKQYYDSPKLLKKSQIGFIKSAPHLLSMTATPIPRTLALTLYGDLDLSMLDEMPPGRIKIITKVVSPKERENTYEFIRKEIKNGRQAFVICPRIEAKDPNIKLQNTNYKLQTRLGLFEMKAVKEEYKKLKEHIFPEFEIAMLHGKLKPKEKEEIMKKFSAKSGSASGKKERKIDILVSTSVVEVGVDVPNATIMMIEGGERFGLAQLHQFRGRVGRGKHQSYCFVFTESATEKTRERLRALQNAKNGFELAEYDLMSRGPGELYGKNQWGMSDVGMEALKNIKMVEAARFEAQNLINQDHELKKYPLLKQRVEEIRQKIHFE